MTLPSLPLQCSVKNFSFGPNYPWLYGKEKPTGQGWPNETKPPRFLSLCLSLPNETNPSSAGGGSYRGRRRDLRGMDGDQVPHGALELDSLPFGLSANPAILKSLSPYACADSLVNLGLFDAWLELRLVAVLIGFWMGLFSSWPLPIFCSASALNICILHWLKPFISLCLSLFWSHYVLGVKKSPHVYFNTVSEENKLECHIGKEIKTRCHIGKKMVFSVK
jgi:hypothetical protein